MKKNIKITSDTVYITCKSKDFYQEYESVYLTNILINKGSYGLELYLLKTYEEGNSITAIPNKYSKAIERLKKLPIYKEYNWRYKDYNNEIEKNRNSEKFNRLLLDSLKLKK